MPGYFMGMVHGIKDEAAFGDYRDVAMPTIEQYVGRPVLISSGVKTGEGD